MRNQNINVMTKDEILALQTEGVNNIQKVYDAIIALTKDNPLILFDKERDDLNEVVYELPYSYYVGKYEYYNQGAIYKVHGNQIELFLTGEEWGEEWHQELHDVPIWSRLDILELLAERM